MFRDDAQKAAASRLLLERVELSHLIGAEGPTAEAFALFDTDGGDLEGDARILLQTVAALWRGTGGPKIREIQTLAPENLVAVSSLMRCASESADMIDSWLRVEE